MKIELKIIKWRLVNLNLFDNRCCYILNEHVFLFSYKNSLPFSEFKIKDIKNILTEEQFEECLKLTNTQFKIFELNEEVIFYKCLKFPEIQDIINRTIIS